MTVLAPANCWRGQCRGGHARGAVAVARACVCRDVPTLFRMFPFSVQQCGDQLGAESTAEWRLGQQGRSRQRWERPSYCSFNLMPGRLW